MSDRKAALLSGSIIGLRLQPCFWTLHGFEQGL